MATGEQTNETASPFVNPRVAAGAAETRPRSVRQLDLATAASLLEWPGVSRGQSRDVGDAMEGIAPIARSQRASKHRVVRPTGAEVESEHAFGTDWLMLSEHRLDGGPITHVYLYVEDVASIIPAGSAAKDCPWGIREAKLTDPDGNEVRVGAPVPPPPPRTAGQA